MKNKRIILLFSILLLIILPFNIKSYAVTVPELMITSNNYSVGDKMRFDDEIENVEVGKSLQLYSVIAHGNEMHIPDNPDSTGWFVDEVNLSGVNWISSNTNIATVSSSGLVIGVSEGKATITAEHNGETANCELNIKACNYIFEPLQENGPNPSMIKKGSVVNETFNLWNNVTEKFEVESIDPSEIKVEVSDSNIVSIENNIITAKEEGELTVKYKYKYTYNNMNFEFERTYSIYTDGFETTYEFPTIKKSYLNLKVGDTSDTVYVGIDRLGSYAVEYPEGYNSITYYKFNWKVEDPNIVKINKLSDNEITATALKSGTTNIICTISTADGNETINKTIKVTVNNNATSQDGNSTNTSKNDNTIANKILPATGKGIIIFILILGLIITAIIFSKKRKIE